MHLTRLFSYAIFSWTTLAATSAPVEDVGRLASALDKISDKMHQINAAIDAFNGDVVDASNILTQYDQMAELLTSSTASIAAITPEPVEIVYMLSPSADLIADLTAFANKIIAKKPDFDKDEISSVVLDTLITAQKLSVGMIETISAKVPEKAHRVVNHITKQVQSQLQRAITAYGGPKMNESAHGEVAAAAVAAPAPAPASAPVEKPLVAAEAVVKPLDMPIGSHHHMLTGS